MQKNFLLHLLLLPLACFFIFLTATKTIEISRHSDLSTLSCGWPLEFILNDQSNTDPPLPWKTGCFASSWGDPIKFYWPQFLVNVAFFYVLLLAALGVFVLVRKKMGNDSRSFKSLWYEIIKYVNIILWILLAIIFLIIIAFILGIFISPSPQINIIPLQQ